MSKESALKAAPAIPAIKILPPQISKLKKEEEEETWISGEELYTEGSSDEENCRCEARSTDVSKESSLSLVARPHRPKNKLDKKLPRAWHSRSTSAEDRHNTPQSTSKSHRQSPRSSATDEEEEEEVYVADDEISWKANRDEIQLEEEIFALREYPKICESMDSIFRDFIERLNHLEGIESENYLRQKENFENDLRNRMAFFDAAIDKLQCEIECVKRNTKQVQLQNRSRLNEITKGGPKSKKLEENTRQFIELYDQKQNELSDLKDLSSERSKDSDRSESIQLSELTEDRVKLLNESIASEVETPNTDDFRSTASNN